MRKVSLKRAAQNREYLKLRKIHLEENPKCAVCKGKALELHHKIGRTGKRLTQKEYFLSVCRTCHQKIELNPIWAKDNGYSLNRYQNNL